MTSCKVALLPYSNCHAQTQNGLVFFEQTLYFSQQQSIHTPCRQAFTNGMCTQYWPSLVHSTDLLRKIYPQRANAYRLGTYTLLPVVYEQR